MRKRQKEAEDAYEAMWDNGKGSHHPDYDPDAVRCPPLSVPTRAQCSGRAACHQRVKCGGSAADMRQPAICLCRGVTTW